MDPRYNQQYGYHNGSNAQYPPQQPQNGHQQYGQPPQYPQQYQQQYNPAQMQIQLFKARGQRDNSDIK